MTLTRKPTWEKCVCHADDGCRGACCWAGPPIESPAYCVLCAWLHCPCYPPEFIRDAGIYDEREEDDAAQLKRLVARVVVR